MCNAHKLFSVIRRIDDCLVSRLKNRPTSPPLSPSPPPSFGPSSFSVCINLIIKSEWETQLPSIIPSFRWRRRGRITIIRGNYVEGARPEDSRLPGRSLLLCLSMISGWKGLKGSSSMRRVCEETWPLVGLKGRLSTDATRQLDFII